MAQDNDPFHRAARKGMTMGKPTSTAAPVEMLVMRFHHCDWPFEDDDTKSPDDDEYKWLASNRVKSQRSNKAKFWCSKCDMALVGQAGKCPKCGNVENKKRKRGIAT
jgi:hypothetical protein